MRVQGVGELTDHNTYWRLTYDECGHVQEFAREGLDEPEGQPSSFGVTMPSV
jgi:hypothetical protein